MPEPETLKAGTEVDFLQSQERKNSFENGSYPGEVRVKRCRNEKLGPNA